MNKIHIADLDVVFLTFDEPQKEEFWVKVKNLVPWARRVDGVKGSDSAHKAAAQASSTERFILIDGDNLPDPEFFNLTLEFPDDQWNQAVYRWRARNHINGLMYGNGGLSCWTKAFVNNMQTHENSLGDSATAVEFCYDKLYWPMHDCYSTTYPNGTPFQAWRAGFREGVKMCLDRGRRVSLGDFHQRIHRRNLDHLTIWHNVGADVNNGLWAIAGAQMGTSLVMLTDWNYHQVQWFDSLVELWKSVESIPVDDLLSQYQDKLTTQLNLPINVLSPQASRFFKHHYRSDWVNQGVMVREIDTHKTQKYFRRNQ